MLKRILSWFALTVALLTGIATVAYFRDMHRAYERIRGKSKLIPSPWGDIEHTEGGAGPAVLVIHGSGGGYDQGELMVRTLLDDRFHWIAPSRFGYLRSTFQPGATFDDQADAYAFLLDHLGIESAAVVALSHGGPSALLLAVRHPDRVSSLTLVSAGVASSEDPAQAQANQQGDALMKIYQKDIRYWALTKVFRKRFLELMGADETVIDGLTAEQRELGDQVIDFMNPVSQRSVGAAFDNQAALPNERIAAIEAPTLIFHAKDDTLQLYRNAEFAAAKIPGARLVSFDCGGHLLMIVEQATLRGLIQQHIREHAGR